MPGVLLDLFRSIRLFEASDRSLPASAERFERWQAPVAHDQPRAALVSRLANSVVLQAAFAAAVCVYVAMLHLTNDGLWFQGDAPRHAGNGLFWWDFVSTLPLNPKEFAFSYHARYPANNPVAYPPLFYLIEGAAFALFGRSPLVAKALVLATLFVAVGYTIAWLRRWVSTLTGWGGALLAMQPAMIAWSHAIMLNVPSTALAVAGLYHCRRALEEGRRAQTLLAAVFLVATCFTYYPAGLVIPIAILWTIARRKLTWRVSAIGVAVLAALLPLAFAVSIVKPRQIAPLFVSHNAWLFFPSRTPRIFHVALLILAVVGILVGLCWRRYRAELAWLGSWLAVAYIGFTSLAFPDPRYLLFAGPPIVILAMLAIAGTAHLRLDAMRGAPMALAGGVLVLLLAHAVAIAPYVFVPRVDGFREVVSFIERVNPSGLTFYQGFYNGTFTFYLQANDPHFQRGVVVAHRLFSAPRFRSGQVVTPDEVLQAIRKRCGCEWIVVEQGPGAWRERMPGRAQLRTTLAAAKPELVRSFEIADGLGTTVDVYRLRGDATTLDRIDVSIPRFGGTEDVYPVKPFRR